MALKVSFSMKQTQNTDRSFLHLRLAAASIHLYRTALTIGLSTNFNKVGSQFMCTVTMMFFLRLSSNISRWYALAVIVAGPGSSSFGVLLPESVSTGGFSSAELATAGSVGLKGPASVSDSDSEKEK